MRLTGTVPAVGDDHPPTLTPPLFSSPGARTMFDQFKTMGALGGLLKNKEKLAQASARVKQTLDDRPATGESGGGAVRVMVGSSMTVLRIEIAPAVVAGMGTNPQTHGQVESLITDATNDALKAAQDRLREAVEREARELGIDGLGEYLGGLLP